MVEMKTNCLLAVCAVALFSACTVFAQGPADTYPAKPVRVIVGLAPGGGTDIQARLLAQRLSANLNRSFVVDNRTGAGGTVAYALVAKSPADGYTLLAVASGYSITPAVYSKLPYDPIKDFAPISLVVQAPILLMTHPSLPVKSTRELVALAKARPGVLNSASAGYGTSNHLALELFNLLAGTRITHVPYKGTGPALIDAMAGQVHVIFGNILSSLPYVRQGRLKALAVTSATRSKAVPELATVAESGVPGYETTTWHGWLAPAATPPAIINRMSGELAKAVRSPEVQESLAGDGGEPVGGSPEQFTRHLVAEIARWRKVVTDAGMRVE
jgi:tripartite-type tricarboxylate transporter receptor subunit TctC